MTKNVSGGIITITKDMTNSSHNGKAIFKRTTNGGNPSINASTNSCSNLRIANLCFKILAGTSTSEYKQVVYILNTNNCAIDSCQVYSAGATDGISLNTCSNISMTNNWIQINPNSNTSDDQCDITIGAGTGGHIITGNTLIQGGSSSSSAVSCENIYIGSEGGSGLTMPQILIANNFMLYDAPNAGGGGASVAAIYAFANNSLRLLIYNNVIMQNTINMDGFQIVGT